MKVNVIKGFRHKTTDSKSVELRFMSVRVGLGVPLKLNVSMGFSENECVKNSTGHYNLIRHRE